VLERRLLRRYELRFGTIVVREQPLESFQLRKIVVEDERTVRMTDEIVLMIAFSRIKGLKRLYASRNSLSEYMRLIELRDVASGDSQLRLVASEDR